MNYNKLIFVERNFTLNSQEFNKDAIFTIIERFEKNVLENIAIIEILEDKLMQHLQTLTPNGFNIKLKGIDLK